MSEPMKVKVEIEVQDIAEAIIRKLTEDGTLVEVVRCKACLFQKYCRTAQYLGNDGYCSNGKRRDDDESV